ncbi:MAG: hypothetical protein EA356_14065 [Geminicoccaceae bacterium]|nr:MAG: hypothetical protein EA356_14065 [Geminicoccaceae bacterium]
MSSDVKDARLAKLLERARKTSMSPSEKAEQRRSFAYGNAAFENPRITRQTIQDQEKALKETS